MWHTRCANLGCYYTIEIIECKIDLGSVAVNVSDYHARGRGIETRPGKCRFSNDGSLKHYHNTNLHLVVSLYKVYIFHNYIYDILMSVATDITCKHFRKLIAGHIQQTHAQTTPTVYAGVSG